MITAAEAQRLRQDYKERFMSKEDIQSTLLENIHIKIREAATIGLSSCEIVVDDIRKYDTTSLLDAIENNGFITGWSSLSYKATLTIHW